MADLLAAPALGNAIPDAAQRRDALDVRRSWIVEAPAGSGKTGLLMQRYLKLLGDEQVSQPEEVLAITFTLKATAELRDRIVEQLEKAHRGEDAGGKEFDVVTRQLAAAVLTRSAALGWDLLNQPQRLNIRTIDSLCADIAGSLPLLSGSGGARRPVTTPEPLYREAARRTLMQLGGEDAMLHDALHTLLLHRDGNLSDCERLIATMLQWRDQWGELVPLGTANLEDSYLDQAVRPRLEHALEQIVCAGLTRLAQIMPATLLALLTALAAELSNNDGYQGGVSPISICNGRYTSPGEQAEHLSHWRALIHLLVAPSTLNWRAGSGSGINKKTVGFEITPAERARLIAITDQLRGRDDLLEALCAVDCLPPVQYPEEQWVVVKALFRLLNRALAELKVLFAEREECDFVEMSLAAREALRQGGGADDYAAARGAELRHLLVDEVQDTSLGQYELIELLTRGWDGQSQTLFLVGDPKQSIYLFRQARVERFLRTMHTRQLGEVHLDVLRLTANFRSQAALVEQCNADFALVFSQRGANPIEGEVPFIASSAVREASASEGRVWHAHPLPAGTTQSAEQRASAIRQQALHEAEEVRRLILEWRARPLPSNRTKPWTIAVLVRSRSHLAKIVPVLKQTPAVAFRAVEIDELGERQEVSDIFALTRALLHPADRVAWFAVLHAPWCGLGLADLHRLAGEDDFSTWGRRSMKHVIAERADLLTPEPRARLQRTWDVLRAALAQRGRMPVAQWVERTWRSLGGDAYATPEELGNVQSYLRLLDQMEQESAWMDMEQLQQRMRRLFAEPLAADDAVDVMTIHQAKGLEWDVVIVPALERGPNRGGEPLLSWLEMESADEAGTHLLLAPIRGTGRESEALNQWLRRNQAEREKAEQKRLFYVACTRAREALHLFAAPRYGSKGEPSVIAQSLLGAAWPAAQQHFPDASVSNTSEEEEAETGEEELLSGPPSPIIPMLRRAPLTFDPLQRFREVRAHKIPDAAKRPAPAAKPFERPEGSFAARAFGNTVHACMEVLAARFAQGTTSQILLKELPTWNSRIAALLRNGGVPPANLKMLGEQTARALENTLRDTDGLWLLAPHTNARSEHALDLLEETQTTLRLDRMFLAGPEPGVSGDDFLWIVDFKTSAPGGRNAEDFFARQRESYRPQMEAYARALQAQAEEQRPIRLALYYPLASKLLWWTY